MEVFIARSVATDAIEYNCTNMTRLLACIQEKAADRLKAARKGSGLESPREKLDQAKKQIVSLEIDLESLCSEAQSMAETQEKLIQGHKELQEEKDFLSLQNYCLKQENSVDTTRCHP